MTPSSIVQVVIARRVPANQWPLWQSRQGHTSSICLGHHQGFPVLDKLGGKVQVRPIDNNRFVAWLQGKFYYKCIFNYILFNKLNNIHTVKRSQLQNVRSKLLTWVLHILYHCNLYYVFIKSYKWVIWKVIQDLRRLLCSYISTFKLSAAGGWSSRPARPCAYIYCNEDLGKFQFLK